jgi:sterol-4alpha-carboxylate 3-dehydrogenase (decarboxylating)
LGNGEDIVKVVSIENAATAHFLAAKALLDPSRASGKVDGEAFIVSDSAPVPFWRHMRLMWQIARGQHGLDIIVLSAMDCSWHCFYFGMVISDLHA